ncbi:ribonuclease H-like domain-containing protein [Tanacetum coccineum]
MTRRVLLRCDSTGDLYPITKPSTIPHAFITSQYTWHQRLGHPGSEVLHRILSSNLISDYKEKHPVLCHACQLGKHVRLSFVSSNTLVKSCFVVVHSDLWTFPMSSLSGFKSYTDAFNDPNWRNAMCDEYNALIKNNTWTLVPRPTDANIVRCMWLFRHKYLADDTLSRYEARLVVNGSTQLEGIDVDETFSLAVKPSTIRTILSLATFRHWPVHQLDVKNALLHGDLSETVYMHQPSGFRDSAHPDYVYLLQRSLYGLKQTHRAWFQRFTAYITRVGFHHSRCDTSLFIYMQGADTAYLLLYVDDIVLIASFETLLQHIIASLHREFSMTDLGSLNYFLGSLQYLTFTHPDISYAVQQVCLYMNDPQEPHFLALKRILRYVCGTLDYGLQLFSSFTTSLVAYSDANWAECCGVANIVAEMCWLRNYELHIPLFSATLVYCDNVSDAYLSSILVQHQRTKHIEIDIHFVRDLVVVGQVRVLHVLSRYQYADIFNKRLPSSLFKEFRTSLSAWCPPAPTVGEC